MKKLSLIVAIILLIAPAAPGHAFFDYLFGGGATKDSIDNSAVGDLRAWWTGNPVYQFNPYYGGSSPLGTGQNNQAAGGGQYTGVPNASPTYGAAGASLPMQQPTVSYYPPAQAQQQYGQAQPQMQQQYGYGQPQPQAQQAYGAAPQAMPQAQAQPVMQYQQPVQQYQAPAQAYQQTAPMQYQQPAPQGYSPQGYAPQQGAQYYPPQQYQ